MRVKRTLGCEDRTSMPGHCTTFDQLGSAAAAGARPVAERDGLLGARTASVYAFATKPAPGALDRRPDRDLIIATPASASKAKVLGSGAAAWPELSKLIVNAGSAQ